MKNIALLLCLGATTVACSKKGADGAAAGGDDKCAAAFTRIQTMSGAMGGRRYGGGMQNAIGFGMACAKLTEDDLKCLTDAKNANDIAGCTHVATVMKEVRREGRGGRGPERMLIHDIEGRAKAYYAQHNAVPPSAPLMPATDCCTQDKASGMCAGNAEEWHAQPNWAAIDFTVAVAQPFQYELVASDKSIKIRAVGDPKCDGNKVTIEDEVDLESGRGKITRTGGPKGEAVALADAKAMVDKLCGCADDACLVALGRTDGAKLMALNAYEPSEEEKADFEELRKKMRECRRKEREKKPQ